MQACLHQAGLPASVAALPGGVFLTWPPALEPEAGRDRPGPLPRPSVGGAALCQGRPQSLPADHRVRRQLAPTELPQRAQPALPRQPLASGLSPC